MRRACLDGGPPALASVHRLLRLRVVDDRIHVPRGMLVLLLLLLLLWLLLL